MADKDHEVQSTVIDLKPVQGPEDEQEHKYVVPLDGKWISGKDPSLIGKNFSVLTNMRYADGHPESILGMDKINSTKMDATYFKVRSALHFQKGQPDENHLLVQAFNSGETGAQVLDNKTTVPTAGEFEATELWTDSVGAGIAQFSQAPNGQIAYCNGVDTCIWGGDEKICDAFIIFDPDGDFNYDFSERVTNTKTDSANVAYISTATGGIDVNCLLMLHLDNNVTDSSATGSTVTNNNVTFSVPQAMIGTHAAVFNGTTAYLTVRI